MNEHVFEMFLIKELAFRFSKEIAFNYFIRSKRKLQLFPFVVFNFHSSPSLTKTVVRYFTGWQSNSSKELTTGGR